MIKRTYDVMQKAGVPMNNDKHIIEVLVNDLIKALYKPSDNDLQFVVDVNRIDMLEINLEPINWGDLKVCGIEKKGSKYVITIDEAAPDDCPTFCAYIEKYMKAWGWPVSVKTEW